MGIMILIDPFRLNICQLATTRSYIICLKKNTIVIHSIHYILHNIKIFVEITQNPKLAEHSVTFPFVIPNNFFLSN